ncbi:MAG: hypothetical protein U0470_10385 [Anaerolineae bacterium]
MRQPHTPRTAPPSARSLARAPLTIAACAAAFGAAALIASPRLPAPRARAKANESARVAEPGAAADRAYLPYVVRSPACRLDATYADIVLVLDRSTSMLRAIEPSALTKNDAAIRAARDFRAAAGPGRRTPPAAATRWRSSASTTARDRAAADGRRGRGRGRARPAGGYDRRGHALDLAFGGGAAALMRCCAAP